MRSPCGRDRSKAKWKPAEGTSVEGRNNGLRVKGVATSGAYGQQAYGQRGYGQQRYQNGYNANAQADLAFNCKVNSRGQVTGVNITRNNMGYRGY